MKKLVLLFAFVCACTFSNAQQTAMQFTGVDCNNNPVDLFADLDAGKAVVLFYYMPNCGSCPPPAQQIQSMANTIMNTFPGMVKGYAYPYQNTTSCTYSASWVTNNNLAMYAPMDSGATQVAYYGGFGMPTVVLLGGTDHRVMWSTLSFMSSDTAIMRDSILNLFAATGINDPGNTVSNVSLYPNPANDKLQLEMNVLHASPVKVEIVNLLGETVSTVSSSPATGTVRLEIPTAGLGNGAYFVRITAENRSQEYKFVVAH
jgi:hypothetical protein